MESWHAWKLLYTLLGQGVSIYQVMLYARLRVAHVRCLLHFLLSLFVQPSKSQEGCDKFPNSSWWRQGCNNRTCSRETHHRSPRAPLSFVAAGTSHAQPPLSEGLPSTHLHALGDKWLCCFMTSRFSGC